MIFRNPNQKTLPVEPVEVERMMVESEAICLKLFEGEGFPSFSAILAELDNPPSGNVAQGVVEYPHQLLCNVDIGRTWMFRMHAPNFLET